MGLNNRNIFLMIFFCILTFVSFDAKAGCYATFVPSSNEITVKWDMSGCDYADDSQTQLFEVCWSHGSLSTSANSCNINRKQFTTQTGSYSIPASPAITYDTRTSYYSWHPKDTFAKNRWMDLNRGSVTTPAEVVTTPTVSHCKAGATMSPGKITVNWDLQSCDNLKLSGDYAKVCWSYGALDTFGTHCTIHSRRFSDLVGAYDIFTKPGETYKVSFGYKDSVVPGLLAAKNIMQATLGIPASSTTQDEADSGRAKIVTLGDSYASGDGFYRGNWGYTASTADDKYHAFTYNKSRECWRATMHDETPGPRLALEKNMQSIFYACKGARVENLQVQYDYLKSKWPVDVSKKWAGSAFIVVGGGNDLSSQAIGDDPEKSWVSIIAKCQTSTVHCSQEKYKFNNLSVVHDKLFAFYSRLATEASSAKIRVLGYPQVMKATNGRCKGAETISVGEANFMDAEMARVSAMIMGVVKEVKDANPKVDIKFVDSNPYITDGACTADGGQNANRVKDIHSVVWNIAPWNSKTDTGRLANPDLAQNPLPTIPLGAETNAEENKCAADAIAQIKACAVAAGSGRGRLVNPAIKAGEGKGEGSINTTIKAGQGRDIDAPLNTTVKAGQGRDSDAPLNTTVKAGEGKDNQINCNATVSDMRGNPINTSAAGSGKGDPEDNVNDCDLIRSSITSNQVLSIDGNGGRAGATKTNDQNSNAKFAMPDVMTDASFHPTRRGWQKFYEALKASW
jgi:hypothetical protein